LLKARIPEWVRLNMPALLERDAPHEPLDLITKRQPALEARRHVRGRFLRRGFARLITPSVSAIANPQVGIARVEGIEARAAAGIQPLAHIPDRPDDIDGGGEERKKGIVSRIHLILLQQFETQV
jgi:hypothetical protein